ncbi:trans-acting enoyl reductase family protein [Aliiglaciecola sp. SL4]|uniref:saccharopine dehydrogenase family protein n=1 Tax=Aliiglaciecola sp. SL4 TaxID=3239806 RepID=UPI00355C54AD
MSQSHYDLIIYGATSFVGKLLVAHLLHRHGVEGDKSGAGRIRWAIAGRNQSKLNQLKLALRVMTLPTIIADASDRDALDDMVSQTKVVVSTVGPYAIFGSELVAACAASGTHYCDLTGEAQWIRRIVDTHELKATETGAKIVHSCGFDSIPSDLGVWFIQQQAMESFGEPCSRVRLLVKCMRGSASGGTIASALNAIAEQSKDPSVALEMANPYSIAPLDYRHGIKQPQVITPEFHKASGNWLIPFVMSVINTRIVHRSHALLGQPWGKDFQYDEAVMVGSGTLGWLKSAVACGAMASGMKAMEFSMLREFAAKQLPQPGEGPSPREQEQGCFNILLFGETASGKTIETQVTGDRDPGYGSTSKMLGEVAAALAQDMGSSKLKGGFWTPSTLFGDELIDCLVKHASLTFVRLH